MHILEVEAAAAEAAVRVGISHKEGTQWNPVRLGAELQRAEVFDPGILDIYSNWAWLVLVATAHNLIRWTQLLGKLEPDADLKAKRFRYRYLNIPALLVNSGRKLVLKLRRDYPLLEIFLAALRQLRGIPAPAT